jgi:hypothetical protein
MLKLSPPREKACDLRNALKGMGFNPEERSHHVRFLEGPFRRDVLVTSAVPRSMINSLFPGTTSVPLRILFRRDLLVRSVSSEGPARRVRFSGGTCLSGPPFNVGSSVPFYRGLKSRGESGAKAMECGDLSPLSGEGFSLPNRAVDPDPSVWQIDEISAEACLQNPCQSNETPTS